jgi:hypothetical protein
MSELAEVAYDAYCKNRDWKSVKGEKAYRLPANTFQVTRGGSFHAKKGTTAVLEEIDFADY